MWAFVLLNCLDSLEDVTAGDAERFRGGKLEVLRWKRENPAELNSLRGAASNTVGIHPGHVGGTRWNQEKPGLI